MVYWQLKKYVYLNRLYNKNIVPVADFPTIPISKSNWLFRQGYVKVTLKIVDMSVFSGNYFVKTTEQ